MTSVLLNNVRAYRDQLCEQVAGSQVARTRRRGARIRLAARMDALESRTMLAAPPVYWVDWTSGTPPGSASIKQYSQRLCARLRTRRRVA